MAKLLTKNNTRDTQILLYSSVFILNRVLSEIAILPENLLLTFQQSF